MKKPKPQNFISVSAKKTGALKHQMLFTPYKIEWKNVQGDSVTSKNRTFFTSMKNELSCLKSDVQKWIKKDGNQIENKGPKSIYLDDNHSKKELASKSLNTTSRKEIVKEKELKQASPNQRYATVNYTQQNYNTLSNTQEDYVDYAKQMQLKQQQIDNLQKENKLQRNLICSLKKENQEIYKQFQQNHAITQESQTCIKKLNQQIQQLNNTINKLNQQKDIQTKNDQINREQIDLERKQWEELLQSNEELRAHNSFLQQKFEGISQKMSLVSLQYQAKEQQMKDMQLRSEELQSEMKKHRTDLEQNVRVLQRKGLEEKEKYESIIKSMKTEFENKTKQMRQSNDDYEEMIQENKRLLNKCKMLEIHLKQNRSNQQKRAETDLELVSTEFEKRINELIDENYSLKNKITFIESSLQKLSIQKNGLQMQVQLYEERDQQFGNRSHQKQEWQRIVSQNSLLKRERENIIDELEYKILKLQNELQQKKAGRFQKPKIDRQNSSTNFNKIMNDQLRQNERLREQLKSTIQCSVNTQKQAQNLQQKCTILTEQLDVQKISELLSSGAGDSSEIENKENLRLQFNLLSKKYEQLKNGLQESNRKIRLKEEFIEKVLYSKVGKKQEEEEVSYILKEIKASLIQI